MTRSAWVVVALISSLVSPIYAQSLIQAPADSSSLFDQFKDDRFAEISDQDVMKKAMEQKRQKYQSLMTQKSPIFFQADRQEIQEKERLFILSGNVSVWKDDFKVKAEEVQIEQWTGNIHARGNVEISFSKDVMTGDEALYNYETGEGWITNVRAAVEPSIFMEGDRLVKLTDYEQTSQGQYILHNGYVTACSGESPDWRVKTRYALIRIENYAHLNKSSFWVSKMPLFYLPYWFYPTKSDRATGLLIPDVSFNTNRGLIASEAFFWAINDYMDMTLKGTVFTEVGFGEEFEWRNALDQYSRGNLRAEHLKERESPYSDRNPKEFWNVDYEQAYILPWDVRATANVNYRSDQYFDREYGHELEQQADRFAESRVSLSKYWNLSRLVLDGDYQKDFDSTRNERLEHLPRLEYDSGYQTLFGILKGSLNLKGENIAKQGRVSWTETDLSGTTTISDTFDRDALRGGLYSEVWLDIKEVPWFTLLPWVSWRETVWNTRKTIDPRFPDATWATRPSEFPVADDSVGQGVFTSGEWIRREMYGYGVEWMGPKLYRIFPVDGLKISKIKHLIEPRIDYKVTPEVLQEDIVYFDSSDYIEPGEVVTFSITNRFLAKLKSKKEGGKFKTKSAESDDGNSESNPSATPPTGDPAVDTESSEASEQEPSLDGSEKSESEEESDDKPDSESVTPPGESREFCIFAISQTYDFMKARNWDKRPALLKGQEDRTRYPLGNLKLDATINPFDTIYFSARSEFDPFYHDFSNSYLYGHTKTKDWKFGIRWDYTKNFQTPLFDFHSLALEGGLILNERWSFASWVKYDFQLEYFTYWNLDLTYTSQCWSATLHTYYSNTREGFGIPSNPYVDSSELQFGISIKLKNLESVGPRKLGKFWWGE